MISPPILIVLYNPSARTISRISELEKRFKIYLFDNSPNVTGFNFSFSKYYHSTCNIGISGALKWMLSECSTSGISSFIFFDQDTDFTSQTIEAINNQLHCLPSGSAAAHFSSDTKRKGLVRFVINSGTLFFTEPLQKISPILDHYFVDGVDLAICYYARLQDYVVSSNFAPAIDHLVEQGIQTWSFLGTRFSGKIYNKTRRRDFRISHFRLIRDCLVNFHLVDSILLVKFFVSYVLHQLKCDILTTIAVES